MSKPQKDLERLYNIEQTVNTLIQGGRFNKEEHDSKSRLEITKLYLNYYFLLIAGGFAFCLVYNYGAAWFNHYITLENPIKYADISNTVSIVTTTLSSGMGFVIGYYFKNKE